MKRDMEEELIPQNYNNLSIERKLKFRDNQVRIARDRCVEYHNKIEDLEDAIKVKDMLIEQLENQNDRLIEQRDAQEKQLANYKKALELACKSLDAVIDEDKDYAFYEKLMYDTAKKELEEQK